MASGSMAIDMMTQHGRVAEAQRSWRTPATGDRPRTYRMDFPAKGGPRSCPVDGCLGRAATRTEMRVHLLQQHVLETVAIMEEGNPLHLWCTRCDMLVPWRALNDRQTATDKCARGAEQKRRRLAEAELREILERAFKEYWEPLDNVTAFRYLVQVLTTRGNEWLAVVVNLGKARNSWGWLSQILIREGAYPKVSGHFYKAVAQAVFLSGRRRGCSPRVWSGTCIASRTGSRDVSPGGNRGDGGMGVGLTRHWRRQWGKQALRGSENPSRGGRRRSRSILRRDQLWNSVSIPLGDWE